MGSISLTFFLAAFDPCSLVDFGDIYTMETSTAASTTLEDLLDAGGPSASLSKTNESSMKRKSDAEHHVLHPKKKQACTLTVTTKEKCIELLSILLQQDVHGIFHFPSKIVSIYPNIYFYFQYLLKQALLKYDHLLVIVIVLWI